LWEGGEPVSAKKLARLPAGVGLVVALGLSGCAPVPPPVVEAEGTVYLDGKPLPLAQVEFVPDLRHFGPELNSFAVTDEQGRFHLSCTARDQPGAVAATHRVLVTEPPTPAEFRSQDERVQARYANYLAGLKNRPIPPEYGTLARTPLVVEVKAGRKTYDLQLSRSKP
jgi:hypothetical protein